MEFPSAVARVRRLRSTNRRGRSRRSSRAAGYARPDSAAPRGRVSAHAIPKAPARAAPRRRAKRRHVADRAKHRRLRAPRRRIVARAARQRPRPGFERPSEDDQRRGDHHQQLVLDHVHGEGPVAPTRRWATAGCRRAPPSPARSSPTWPRRMPRPTPAFRQSATIPSRTAPRRATSATISTTRKPCSTPPLAASPPHARAPSAARATQRTRGS